MKKPLDAARDLVDCFKWDLDGALAGNFDENKVMPGRTIPRESWAPVVIALRKFLNGECETLDEAFGRFTRSYRTAATHDCERERLKWLVDDYADVYRKLPKEKKVWGSPKDHGIAEVAKLFEITESKVRAIYNGDR